MSFTPKQQYRLLLDFIEETLRLAKIFGLNKGVLLLEEFRTAAARLHTPKAGKNPIAPFSTLKIHTMTRGWTTLHLMSSE